MALFCFDEKYKLLAVWYEQQNEYRLTRQVDSIVASRSVAERESKWYNTRYFNFVKYKFSKEICKTKLCMQKTDIQ